MEKDKALVQFAIEIAHRLNTGYGLLLGTFDPTSWLDQLILEYENGSDYPTATFMVASEIQKQGS